MADRERIAIVGLGLIGGSLALALRRARPDLRLVGVDVDARSRELALNESAVDAATTVDDAPLEVCDVVVLCAPAQPLLDMLPAVAAGAAKVLDVDAGVHDRAVTYASHLPYLVAAAVVDAVLSANDPAGLARELAAGGFRDTTRLAGDGTVAGAAALNRFVPDAARALAERLRNLADDLEKDPHAALDRLGKLADERRRMRLPPAGFAAPVPPQSP